ncbi:hypothetical protein [Bacillus sp. AFS076308]|nr:hypothetical protein [Bacillus sp. AFS076308]
MAIEILKQSEVAAGLDGIAIEFRETSPKSLEVRTGWRLKSANESEVATSSDRIGIEIFKRV